MFLVSCIPRYFILFFMAVVNGTAFPIWLSVWLLLVYRNASDFYTLILYSANFAEVVYQLKVISQAKTMGFSRYRIMLSANRDSLTSSLSTGVPFISFSCLLALTRTSNTMLNGSGERGHPCLCQFSKGMLPVFAHSV